jgi:hypothetical protein
LFGSVDLATDAAIGAVCAREFRGCTVLVIAHRIDTVLVSPVPAFLPCTCPLLSAIRALRCLLSLIVVCCCLCLPPQACSRVLVMDRGRAAEFDSPAALLARPDSLFRALVDQAGVKLHAHSSSSSSAGSVAGAPSAAEGLGDGKLEDASR